MTDETGSTLTHELAWTGPMLVSDLLIALAGALAEIPPERRLGASVDFMDAGGEPFPQLVVRIAADAGAAPIRRPLDAFNPARRRGVTKVTLDGELGLSLDAPGGTGAM